MSHPTSSASNKTLVRALLGERCSPPPFWYMRQAGRYLPEYRKLRSQAGSFLDLCYTPTLAAEATLQPVRRFGTDGAILFSDILVVPEGLGQRMEFREGEGPVLDAVRPDAGLGGLQIEGLCQRLEPVYETVWRVSAAVPPGTAVIGFAGAPWTVATYMVEGGSSADFCKVKGWAYTDPTGFQALIDLLVDATVEHLSAQVEAGAEVVQLFDSWAGVLPDAAFRRWCVAPTEMIVSRLLARHAGVPVIVYPRGAGAGYLDVAARRTAAALSLDTTVPLAWAQSELQPQVALQGNLDPILVVTGGDAMLEETGRILSVLGAGPFVFNLGHGLLPQTPPEHVTVLSDFVRNWKG